MARHNQEGRTVKKNKAKTYRSVSKEVDWVHFEEEGDIARVSILRETGEFGDLEAHDGGVVASLISCSSLMFHERIKPVR